MGQKNYESQQSIQAPPADFRRYRDATNISTQYQGATRVVAADVAEPGSGRQSDDEHVAVATF